MIKKLFVKLILFIYMSPLNHVAMTSFTARMHQKRVV